MANSYLLMEDGSYLLLEDGGRIILESFDDDSITETYRLENQRRDFNLDKGSRIYRLPHNDKIAETDRPRSP